MTDMASVCVVESCAWSESSNAHQNTEHGIRNPKPSLHRFPWKHPKLARKWVANVIMSGTAASKITHSSRVCSFHFENGVRTADCVPTIFDITRSVSGDVTQAPKTKTRKTSGRKKTPSRYGLQINQRSATRLGEMITTYKKRGAARPILSKQVVRNGFKDNFLSQITHFWKTKQFCDLRLIIGGFEVLAHQLVFNVARPFCLTSLQSVKGAKPILTLLVPVEASEEAVMSFLTYLYEGSLFITENSVQDILLLGQFFHMSSIEYFCKAFLVAVQRATGSDANRLTTPEKTESQLEQSETTKNKYRTIQPKDLSSTDATEVSESDRKSPVICRKWRKYKKSSVKSATAAESEDSKAADEVSAEGDAYWTAWEVKDVRTVASDERPEGGTTEMDEDENLDVSFTSEVIGSELRVRDSPAEGDTVDEVVREGVDETPVTQVDDNQDNIEEMDTMVMEGVDESQPTVVNVSWSDEENQEWLVMPNESEEDMNEEEEDEVPEDQDREMKSDGDAKEQQDRDFLMSGRVRESGPDEIKDKGTLKEGETIQTSYKGKAFDAALTNNSTSSGKSMEKVEDVKPVILPDGTLLPHSNIQGRMVLKSYCQYDMEGVENSSWPHINSSVGKNKLKSKRHTETSPLQDEENISGESKLVCDSAESEPLRGKESDTSSGTDSADIDPSWDRLSGDVQVDCKDSEVDLDLNMCSDMNLVSPGEVEIDRAEDNLDSSLTNLDGEDQDVKPVILPDGSVYTSDHPASSRDSVASMMYSSHDDEKLTEQSKEDAKPHAVFRKGAEASIVKSEVFEHDNIYFRYYKCDQCPSLFTSKSRQEEHVQVIHEGLRFICKFCGKEFTSKCGHRVHEKDHLGQNQYKRLKCHKCPERFSTKAELRSHKLNVCGGQEFRCKTCYQVFYSQYLYQKHVNEERRKSLECTKCSRSFRDNYSLSKHLEQHLYQEVYDNASKSPAEKYRCKICSKDFNGRKYLLRHKKTAHGHKQEQSKDVQCSDCSLTFKCLSAMRRHFKSDHPNSQLPTSAQMDWRNLVRDSPFQQDYDIDLVSEDELVAEEDVKPVDAEVDLHNQGAKVEEKPRNTRKSKTVPENVTGSKNFHCEECGMSFLFFASLRRHSKSEHPKT